MQEDFSNYYNLLADNIKRLRLLNKISQEKFAEKLGCSREFISRLENYHEKVSLNMLFKISRCFEIEPENLFKK